MSQSLVSAIYERYGEIGECSIKACSISCSINCSEFSGSSSSSSCSPVASPMTEADDNSNGSNQQSSSVSTSPNSNNFASEISFFIPPVCSPRKTQSGLVMTSVKSLIMTDKYLDHVGDHEELENCCRNVLELDLSKNEFMDWNEIKKILNALKNLRLLNLSHNPLTSSINYQQFESREESPEEVHLALTYFHREWTIEQNEFEQLRILILNSCFLDLSIVECLLGRMPNLSELHLASNNYSCVTFSTEFQMHSVKILYLNNNNFSNWCEIMKFGKCFPNLENLVLSDNPLANFTGDSSLTTSKAFQNLEILIINKVYLSEWSVIEQLREFPNLKHVRIQNVPLLNDYNEEEKYYLLVGYFEDNILSLNGSKITNEDKENCERKFIRHYLDFGEKPDRYYELENRHGKLNKLADINMEGNKKVTCKIKFREQQMLHKVDVRQTVGDFKKQLEKFVGYPSSRFKVFYIDTEACSMAIYGPEEMKYLNRCLYSFNIVDGDEFEIDLKPPPVIHSASESLFQHTTSQYHANCCQDSAPSKSAAMRQRKISDNSSSGESQGFTRVTKKTKPISFFSGHLKKSTSKKNDPVDGFCSLPSNLNKKNKTNLKAHAEKNAEPGSSTPQANLVVFTGGQEIDEQLQS